MALAPDLKIIAPWRMTDLWTLQSRDDEIAYCKAHGIDLPFDAKSQMWLFGSYKKALKHILQHKSRQ